MPMARCGLRAALLCLLPLVTSEAAAAQLAPVPVVHAAAITGPVTAPTLAPPVLPPDRPAPLRIPDDEEDTYVPLLPDLEIPLNKKVLAYVRQFTSTRRPTLEDGLARGAQYLPMIRAIFQEEGLPLDLVYLPLIESAFRAKAVSHAGATGLWQFMKATASSQGLKRDWYVDERSNPEKSTRAAAQLLKTLHGTFGDWPLALAAYNAGAGRVQQALKRSRHKDYWSLTAAQLLPRETREYVPLFLASVLVIRNPLQYGLDLAFPDAPHHDVVSLPSPLDLRRAAEWLGISVEQLQALNPDLRRWTTPAAATEYAMKVPAGLGSVLAARLVGGVPLELTHHVVTKGETLATVARKLRVSRADLAEANYLAASARLQPGDTLIVPRAPDLVPTPSTPPASLARGAGGSGEPAGIARTLARLVHRVQPGDTIRSIAHAYSTSIDYLKARNGLLVDAIVPGQELTIFAGPLTDALLQPAH